MQRKDSASLFLQQAIQRDWLKGIEIFLLDIGASGGIDGFWNQFRPHLRAVGFDPLINEVNRLNAEEHDPNISYEAAWVSDGTQHNFPEGSKPIFMITGANRYDVSRAEHRGGSRFNGTRQPAGSDHLSGYPDQFYASNWREVELNSSNLGKSKSWFGKIKRAFGL